MTDVYTYLRRDANDPETRASRHARCGEQEQLIAMIERGDATAVSLAAQDLRGYTVLHELAWRQRSVKAMLTAVLATGTDLNVPDRLGQTPLHHATYVENLLVMNALITAGADLNVRNHLGNTPFHVAFDRGHEKSARLLMVAGADLTVRNNDGVQAIDLSPQRGDTWRPERRQAIRRTMADQERAELLATIGRKDPDGPGTAGVAPRSRARL